MKTKKLYCLITVVMSVMFLLSACVGAAGTATTAPETAAASDASGAVATEAPAAADNGISRIVRIAQCTDVTSLDPQGHNATASGNVTRMIYDCLVRLDTDGKTFVGMLAESWDWLDNNNVQLNLRHGVLFHNGAEMTSADVKFTLERMANSGFSKHLVSMITEIKIVDDYTLVLTVTDNSAALLSSLAHQCAGIVCKAYTEALEAEGKTLSEAPCGTGPYMFDHWTAGSECQVNRFADYYDDAYSAKNEGLLFKYYPDQDSAVIALETGEVDVLLDVPSTAVSTLSSTAGINLLEFESTELTYIALNCSSGVFADQRLREAVAYCINRDNLVQVCCSGYGKPNFSPIGIAAIGYTDTKVQRATDIAKAKELMTEAGCPDGFTFTLLCYPALEKAAQVVQAACQEAGITCNVQATEEAQLCAIAGKGQHDAGMGYWFANAEPDNSYMPLFHSDNNLTGSYNWINLADPTLDGLIEQAQTVKDQTERLAIYGQINDYIAENVIWIPLFSETGFVATSDKVSGIVLYAIEMHLFQNITISE